MLDVSFPLLAEVLGSEDDPLESIAVPHLLAIAYAVGWTGKMLSVVNPTDFAGELEAAIEARGGMQDIGPAADTNLATAQGVATTQVQLDAIDLYVSMYGTIDSFAGHVTALPEVDDGHIDCSSFPRLAKLAVRSGKVPEEKVRSLAGRFRVELPLIDRSDGSSEGEVGLGLGTAFSVHYGACDRVAQAVDDSGGVRC